MFVSGFTFIRNAIKLDYPVKEAILSILPVVDEMVVAVGESDDDTRLLIESLGSKIRIIDTIWDDGLREGGKVLAVETDKALSAVNPKADWCFYIQGDECIHEKYYEELRTKMAFFKDNDKVDGLLFKYAHFYGSYDFLGDSKKWYRNEIRIIKNDPQIKSYRDAQGFRKAGRKLNVKSLDATVFHYGWVRHPKYQMAKVLEANKLWHSDDYIEQKFDADADFDYTQVDSIARFEGSHPAVMTERIASVNWHFDRDPSVKSFSLKLKFIYLVEKLTGWRIGEYKNYKIV